MRQQFLNLFMSFFILHTSQIYSNLQIYLVYFHLCLIIFRVWKLKLGQVLFNETIEVQFQFQCFIW